MDIKASREYIKQLEHKVSSLTRLLDVSTVLNSVLLRTDVSSKTLLSYLMDAAADITNSETATVILWDPDQHTLVFVATTSNDPNALSLIGTPIPMESISGTVFKEKKIDVVNDVAADPRHYKQTDKDTDFITRSLLSIPMISNKRAIGVLQVVNKRDLPWTRDDEANLSLLASEAAVAIEVAQLLLDLQEANEELSELDNLKSSFIAIASHELRTPLGIIMGYASFLQEATDVEVSEHAGKVMAGATQLRAIIENMVSLRYLKQKSTDLHREVVPLKFLVDDLKRDVSTLTNIESRKFSLVCTDEDAEIYIDRVRINMALINVIKNAIAFTDVDGTITMDAKVHNGREVYISVTDDGVGLEMDQLTRVFEEFYQVEDHMIRKHGGLGIGLSIAQALVKAHHGRIWAFSEGIGNGATFTVALPLAAIAIDEEDE